VGRIEKRKNVHLLIDSFCMADLANVDLVIVGRLDEGFTISFPDDARIRHMTDVDDESLIKLYQGAALFVYPSAAEGFGIPLLDGLAFGLPTISSNQTSMPEVGADLPSYFDPTINGAREVLSTLIRDHFRTQPIAAPSFDDRQRLLSHFNWQRFATYILDAACEVARRAP
jgi:alpha-1,3-rhamnosyl/mannosyltransferase